MQDTPSMKFTYDAHVNSPREVMTFMSGNFTREVMSGMRRNWFFSMKLPIPSYDIAILAGDLEER